MTAALETPAVGYPVHLVDASGKLGSIWGEQERPWTCHDSTPGQAYRYGGHGETQAASTA
jgi:hypothetical protein